MKYFPPSPIPHWPKRSRLGGIPIGELVAEAYLDHPHRMSKASARIRSQLYRNGEPMVCLSCGAKTNASGEIPCGH